LQVKAIVAEQQFGQEIERMKVEVIPSLRRWGQTSPADMEVTISKTLEFLARVELYHMLYSKAGMFELGEAAFAMERAPLPRAALERQAPDDWHSPTPREEEFKKRRNTPPAPRCVECNRIAKGKPCSDGQHRCGTHQIEFEDKAKK
jgi:hypothetical protein